jgi:uncharacterized spore protein YtfJ
MSTMFGEPVQREHATVIPVAKARFGFGGGGGCGAGGKATRARAQPSRSGGCSTDRRRDEGLASAG